MIDKYRITWLKNKEEWILFTSRSGSLWVGQCKVCYGQLVPVDAVGEGHHPLPLML